MELESVIAHGSLTVDKLSNLESSKILSFPDGFLIQSRLLTIFVLLWHFSMMLYLHIRSIHFWTSSLAPAGIGINLHDKHWVLASSERFTSAVTSGVLGQSHSCLASTAEFSSNTFLTKSAASSGKWLKSICDNNSSTV